MIPIITTKKKNNYLFFLMFAGLRSNFLFEESKVKAKLLCVFSFFPGFLLPPTPPHPLFFTWNFGNQGLKVIRYDLHLGSFAWKPVSFVDNNLGVGEGVNCKLWLQITSLWWKKNEMIKRRRRGGEPSQVQKVPKSFPPLLPFRSLLLKPARA